MTTLALTPAAPVLVAAFIATPLRADAPLLDELVSEMSAEGQAAFWRSGPPLCIHCR